MRIRLADAIIVILVAWAGLAWLTHALGAGVGDVVEVYPLSLFAGPRFAWHTVPGALVFLIILWIALRLRPSIAGAWGFGVALMFLGIWLQGGGGAVLAQPLAGKMGSQYASVAERISGWVSWLGGFNARQRTFVFLQPRTHPPFATLIFHVFRSAPATAVALTLIAGTSIPLVGRAMRVAGASASRAGECAILFALIPAVNIYGGASLDGVVLAASGLFLLGLLTLLRDGIWRWSAALMLAGGMLVANALTFGGLFLVAVGGVFGLRNGAVRKAMLLTAALALIAYVVLRAGFGYDHVAAFVTATRAENPRGFHAVAAPMHYLLTRLEDVGNVALFLSIPVLAVLLLRPRPERVTLTAVAVLGLMFLTGAYRTGETARACLFVYPFLVLSLRDLSALHMRWVTLAAALQTLVMHVLGDYGA